MLELKVIEAAAPKVKEDRSWEPKYEAEQKAIRDILVPFLKKFCAANGYEYSDKIEYHSGPKHGFYPGFKFKRGEYRGEPLYAVIYFEFKTVAEARKIWADYRNPGFRCGGIQYAANMRPSLYVSPDYGSLDLHYKSKALSQLRSNLAKFVADLTDAVYRHQD